MDKAKVEEFLRKLFDENLAKLEAIADDPGFPNQNQARKLVKLETIPYDPRFPNQNQTKNCFQNYLDYHRCRKVKGEDYQPCEWYKRVYTAICPNAWHEKWDDQREKGIFAADI